MKVKLGKSILSIFTVLMMTITMIPALSYGAEEGLADADNAEPPVIEELSGDAVQDTDKAVENTQDKVIKPSLKKTVLPEKKLKITKKAGIVKRDTTLDLSSEALKYMSTDGTEKTVNMKTTSVTDCAEGWSWDADTHTLTLSGADITGDRFGIVSKGSTEAEHLTITLTDGTESTVRARKPENTTSIIGVYIAGYNEESTRTINGSGTLNVITPDAADRFIINEGIQTDGRLNICGSAKLNVSAGAASATENDYRGISKGILGDRITISGNAKVTSKAGAAKGLGIGIAESNGINAGREFILKDNAEVNTEASEAIGSSFAISAGLYSKTIKISDNAVLKADGVDGILAADQSHVDEWGGIEISGKAEVEANGVDAGVSTEYGPRPSGTLTVSDNAGLTANAEKIAINLGNNDRGTTFNGGRITADAEKAFRVPPSYGENADYRVKAGDDKASAQVIESPVDETYTGNHYVDIRSASYHRHIWDENWSSDDTHHYHECTEEGCPITDNSQKDGYGEHTYGDWNVVTEAVGDTDGLEKRVCTVCGHEQTRAIPAPGSDPEDTEKPGDNDQNADSEENGEDGQVKTGDDSSMMIWILLMAGALAGTGLILRRRHQN